MRCILALLLVLALQLPVIGAEEKKEIFSVRHPKIHRCFRTTRKICIKLTPVVELAGSVAQVILIFI